jgi:protease I
MLATHGFEERELLEPLRALRAEGADVDVIGLDSEPIQAMHLHFKTSLLKPDRVMGNTVLPDQYDSLILPGGPLNADTLRARPSVLKFVRAFHEAEKPIGAISHAAWILISAGIVDAKKITGFHTIREDVTNAGGYWYDEPLVVDGNIITARDTHDLAFFNNALIELLSQRPALISPETRHMLARSRIA